MGNPYIDACRHHLNTHRTLAGTRYDPTDEPSARRLDNDTFQTSTQEP